MIYNLYTIYDRIAQDSGPIFQAKNHGIALRQFENFLSQEIKEDKKFLKRTDFVLEHVSTYDSERRKFQLLESPEEVVFTGRDEGV